MNHTCATEQIGLLASQQAMIQISVIMAAKGGRVANMEVGDCVKLAEITATLPMYFGSGQPICEQLIDRYNIKTLPFGICSWTTCVNARWQ